MNSQESGKRFDPKRAETISFIALLMQVICSLVALAVGNKVKAVSTGPVIFQISAGVMFWLITLIHLRMRRKADEENRDLEEAEKRRQSQGMQALFTDAQEGMFNRNLRQMEKYIAPGASLAISALLLLLPGYYLRDFFEQGFYKFMDSLPQTAVENPLAMFLACIFPALGCFLLGMYASGLSRERGAALLRAGAGNMIASSIFLGSTGLALSLTKVSWIGGILDRILGVGILLWVTLQSVEMIVNFILDIYRPRLAGIETRPVYDSRLSGLLAEPKGLFHTFAHTMDYQFGFKVSDTWFFKFLEKALAPLIIIQLTTLYLLTCFFVVEPGQVAVVEHWGKRLHKPLESGLHVKWPWPIDEVKLIDRQRVRTVVVGFKSANQSEAREKLAGLSKKVVSWSSEHIEDEIKYLMPLPGEMRKTTSDKKTTADDMPTVFLSGTFTLEYSVGDTDEDVFNYVYGFLDAPGDRPGTTAEEAIRALLEREVTVFLAGAHFWDVLSRKPELARKEIFHRVKNAITKANFGVKVINLNVHNLHPPVGETGKAFQKVLASHQEMKKIEYEGEIDSREIRSLTPSEVHKILSDAKAYKISRSEVAKAEAERFLNQIKAEAAAPGVYRTRVSMRVLEDALRNVERKIVIPEWIRFVMEDKKMFSVEQAEINKQVKNEAEKESRK